MNRRNMERLKRHKVRESHSVALNAVSEVLSLGLLCPCPGEMYNCAASTAPVCSR